MTWKKQLQDNITSAAQLREFRQLSEEEERRMDAILHKYPMRVTRYYLSLVDWDNYEEDPIYRLCVPTIREDDLSGSLDTSGESSNTKMPGLQHKYRETALVLTTHECAMYCRHCFRKRLVGLEDEHETVVDPQAVADYVTAHPEVNNVLLSIGVVPYYIFQCRPVTGVGSQPFALVMRGPVTPTAPEPIPFEQWLADHDASGHAPDQVAPNGHTYWDNYIADIDPGDMFLTIKLDPASGTLTIPAASANRIYTLIWTTDLSTDRDKWKEQPLGPVNPNAKISIPDPTAKSFFARVFVELP